MEPCGRFVYARKKIMIIVLLYSFLHSAGPSLRFHLASRAKQPGLANDKDKDGAGAVE